MRSKMRLGRGLAALLNETAAPDVSIETTRSAMRVPIEALRSNSNNPRKAFNDEEIDALALSIRSRGLLQPILARLIAGQNTSYEIIAGERRWRAAQRAGLHDVDIIVLSVTSSESLEIALVENIQRTDLNPIEEARGYKMLIESHEYTQEDIGNIVGKSRSHIANTMRLLNLPKHTVNLILSGDLTAGHARALVNTQNPDALAEKIVKQRLTVREAEGMATSESEGKKPKRVRTEEFGNDIRAWEGKLSAALGTTVRLNMKGTGGDLRIEFASLEHLGELVRKFTIGDC
jgi:ParB family transcriptional regulator, chromosome partitioning protein